MLTSPQTVATAVWPRDRKNQDFVAFVKALDVDRDVVLFPSDEATSADAFPWHTSNESATSTSSSSTHRWRLVVLEASWMYGKKMARQLDDLRRHYGLPLLRTVTLEGVVGRYWRFHSEGLAAVSTIEAIAHTASAAGLCSDYCDRLLILFNLQRYRVLSHVEDGGKVPRAMLVAGTGEGGWHCDTLDL